MSEEMKELRKWVAMKRDLFFAYAEQDETMGRKEESLHWKAVARSYDQVIQHIEGMPLLGSLRSSEPR